MRPEFIYNKIIEELSKERPVAVATLISKEGSGPRDIGAQIVVTEDGRVFGTIGGGSLEKVVLEEALKALSEGKPRLLKLALRREGVPPDAIKTNQMCGGVVEVFVNVVKPSPRVIVAGGGNVGKPIADIANFLGFRVVVIDDKEELANALRFPYAEKVIVGNVAEVAGKLEFGRYDIFVIAYGEVETDYQTLKRLVERGFPGHVWALCSRHRCSWMIKRLMDEGMDLSKFKGRLHMPAGLDIGSDTPEEIAVSIAAEIVCTIKGCRLPVGSLDVSGQLIK